MVSFVTEIDFYTFSQPFPITLKLNFSIDCYDSQCVPCKQEKEEICRRLPILIKFRGVSYTTELWPISRNMSRSLVLLEAGIVPKEKH